MEALADLAGRNDDKLEKALADLPDLYSLWINAERKKLTGLADRRRETAEQLIADMETARARIATGIDVLAKERRVRQAFRFMNLAVATAARRRNAGPTGDPHALSEPAWM